MENAMMVNLPKSLEKGAVAKVPCMLLLAFQRWPFFAIPLLILFLLFPTSQRAMVETKVSSGFRNIVPLASYQFDGINLELL